MLTIAALGGFGAAACGGQARSSSHGSSRFQSRFRFRVEAIAERQLDARDPFLILGHVEGHVTGVIPPSKGTGSSAVELIEITLKPGAPPPRLDTAIQVCEASARGAYVDLYSSGLPNAPPLPLDGVIPLSQTETRTHC